MHKGKILCIFSAPSGICDEYKVNVHSHPLTRWSSGLSITVLPLLITVHDGEYSRVTIHVCWGLFSIALAAVMAFSQSYGQQRLPMHSFPLTLTDGSTVAVLAFGLDPEATDSIDRSLGESELPPLPPSEVFDARFVGFDIGVPLGLGSLKDFRQGVVGTVGKRVHEIMYQAAPGRVVTVQWDLPSGVTAVLEDLYQGSLINIVMADTGRYTVQNPSIFNRLKMTVDYNLFSSVHTQDAMGYTLYQNYPNPFNPCTTIRFSLPKASQTRLTVFTVHGEQVAEPVNGKREPGMHEVLLDGTALASGTYVCRFTAGGFVRYLTMTLLK